MSCCLLALLTALAPLGLAADEGGSRPPAIGGWAAVRAGMTAPVATEAHFAAGVWVGTYDKTWLASNYLALGASVRRAAERQSVLAEAWWGSEFLGGATALGLAAGPERVSPDEAGWLLLGTAGLKWVVLGDHLGPTLRLEAGAERRAGWHPVAGIVVGLEALTPFRR